MNLGKVFNALVPKSVYLCPGANDGIYLTRCHEKQISQCMQKVWTQESAQLNVSVLSCGPNPNYLLFMHIER